MNFSEASALITARVNEQWALLNNGVELLYTNEQRPTFDEKPSIVHVEIRAGAARVVGFGGRGANTQRQSGEVIFRCFVTADTGTTAVTALADAAAAILRFWSSGSLRFFGAGPAGGGEAEKDGNFYELDAICSFEWDLVG